MSKNDSPLLNDPFADDPSNAAFAASGATNGTSGAYASGSNPYGTTTQPVANTVENNPFLLGPASSSSSSSSSAAAAAAGGSGSGLGSSSGSALNQGVNGNSNSGNNGGFVREPLPDFILPSDPERLKAELSKAREEVHNLKQDIAEKELTFEQKEKKYLNAIERLEYPTKKNWPMCYPMLHHDIKDDMLTDQRRKLMRMLYACWLMTVTMTFWTFITICTFWFSGVAGNVVSKYWISFLMGILNIVMGIPLSWILWYWALYSRFKEEKITKNMWVYFFNFTMHILWCLYNVLGFYHGTTGIIVAVSLSSYSHGSNENAIGSCAYHNQCGTAKGILFMFVAAILGWGIITFFAMFIIYKVYRYYKANASESPLDAPVVVPILMGI